MSGERTVVAELHRVEGVKIRVSEDWQFYYIEWRELAGDWREMARTKSVNAAFSSFAACCKLVYATRKVEGDKPMGENE